MKKGLLIVLGILLSVSAGYGGQTGEEIFGSLGCKSCHHPEKATKVNPSLADIALAYEGKEPQLVNYLNGQGDSIVKPEKSNMMKRYVEKTKSLTDNDRHSLADFIMGHKK